MRPASRWARVAESGCGTGSSTTGRTIHSAVWSENDCKSEITLTCITRLPAGGTATNDSVGVTRQQTADGSRITGTVSMAITTTGGDACQGVYGVDYVRR